MRTPVKILAATAFTGLLALAAGTPVSCDSVTSAALPHVTITSAKSVGAGEFSPPEGSRGPATAFIALPAFCRVQASLKPGDDSDIRIEVWLPMAGWNNKLQAVGNGAWGGAIGYPALATALSQGYAAASTDTGHTGNNPTFITDHPEKLIDFAYRSVHEMTVAAKGIIAAYYGQGPKLSYFNGCSTGGRQAMVELQRYPADYDGVIAGDPVYDTSHIQGTQLWLWQIFHKDQAANIPPEKLALLHAAVLAACDALDGVKDGVLEDPTRCGYDPALLQCKHDEATDCLTSAQVEAAKQSYVGPMNQKTGQPVWPGREWGSELGWLNHSGKEPSSYAAEMFRYVVFQNPDWDYRNFDFEWDVPQAEKTLKETMDSVNPDLRAFFEHGGKLIQYQHGNTKPWRDLRRASRAQTSRQAWEFLLGRSVAIEPVC